MSLKADTLILGDLSASAGRSEHASQEQMKMCLQIALEGVARWNLLCCVCVVWEGLLPEEQGLRLDTGRGYREEETLNPEERDVWATLEIIRISRQPDQEPGKLTIQGNSSPLCCET